jgi:hypothetical protein
MSPIRDRRGTNLCIDPIYPSPSDVSDRIQEYVRQIRMMDYRRAERARRRDTKIIAVFTVAVVLLMATLLMVAA